MDKIDLEELERLAAQATPGPWKHRTISKTATVILAADTPLCATKYSVNKDHDAAYYTESGYVTLMRQVSQACIVPEK